MEDNYINIGYRYLKDKNLSDKEKLIVGFISGFAKDECKASNTYMATIFGSTRRTIQRQVSSLLKKDVIRSKILFENGYCTGRILNLNKKYNAKRKRSKAS